MSDRRNEPTAPKSSGYYPSGGYDEGAFDYGIASTYGHGCEWRDGRIVEIGDEESDHYLDGMSELRRLKRTGAPGYR